MPRPLLVELGADRLVLDRYRIIGDRPLGEGGWCVVWCAEDVGDASTTQAKRVAVKTFREQVLRENTAAILASRFVKEVDTFDALGLSHCHRRARVQSYDEINPQDLFVNLLDFSTELGGSARSECNPVHPSLAGSVQPIIRSASPARPSRAKDGRYYLVLELAQESLDSWLRRRAQARDFVCVQDVREVASAIGAGLSWMHTHGLCHLDVKPANVMRFGDHWKLIDLEGAVSLWSSASTISLGCITPLYAPPELAAAVLGDKAVLDGSTTILVSLDPSARLDSWALGVVLLDVLAHECAFQELWSSLQMQSMMCFDVEGQEGIGFQKEWYEWLAESVPIKAGEYLTSLPSSALLLKGSAELQDFLEQLLAKDPKKRMSGRDIMNHPFLTHKQIGGPPMPLEAEASEHPTRCNPGWCCLPGRTALGTKFK